MPNRLINEKSPYLLQHAHNPVDWHPWSEEAFERARLENKPVLVSIGYSTCHWCHVMEKEVFEDVQAAKTMNECFISIKVDREERPDLDHIYMTAAQALTGGGGWPLNVFLTPDKKPFFAATYIPRESSLERIGMLDLAPRILSAWRDRKDEVVESAEKIIDMVAAFAASQTSAGGALSAKDGTEIMDAAFEGLRAAFDPTNGGFGRAPKFPSAHNLSFLLRYYCRAKEKDALSMVEETLVKMRLGGIFDQLGGGFHRYSVDSRWFLPHFEKMLYDQAIITTAYVEAYKITGKAFYKDAAAAICDYVLGELTSPDGAFYCGEDADSEGVEGKFYVWTEGELDALLNKDDAYLAKFFYGVSGRGNFHDEASGEETGQNVLIGKDYMQAAKELGLTAEELGKKLAAIKEKLFKARAGRVRPFRDEKILTDWNGLMIAALSVAGAAFDEPSYCKAAACAADFLLKKMRDGERLLHRLKDSEAAIDGFLDDYAFLTLGLMELYNATFDRKYIEEAVKITDLGLAAFLDKENGGFFFTNERAPDAIVRQKQVYDGAMPSGYSVMALNLLRLGRMIGRQDFEDAGRKALEAMTDAAMENPLAFTALLSAIDFAVGPTFELAISGKAGEPETVEMLNVARSGFYPSGVVTFTLDSAGLATAHLCVDKTCEEPIIDSKRLAERLKAL